MRSVLVVIAACVAATAAHAQHTVLGGGPPDAAAYGKQVEDAYARVRAATTKFKLLDSAVAAGYVANVAQCVVDSVHGAMGYHHINRAIVDNKSEIERPEFLIYERRADSSYVLNGVEYIIPFRVWPKDSVPPKVMGREMLRNDALNLWNLHFWVWKRNPAGLFAEWHPDVKCPPAVPKSDAVEYPEGYRAWTHVKSALTSPSHANYATRGGFAHTYANVAAMNGYRTRVFPEGSAIVVDYLEMTDQSGTYLEGPRRQIDVMVRDSTRFAKTGGWGFQRFMKDSKTERSTTLPPQQCFSCHDSQKKDGLVIGSDRK
ncbi:MAG TPA: cytochrome P460 family protein [Gemmatimonadaceae bacterium]|nr:cytochrome P460 family protein [Gemmatimonadaceae bacterium]